MFKNRVYFYLGDETDNKLRKTFVYRIFAKK